jgi:hypothetical protein
VKKLLLVIISLVFFSPGGIFNLAAQTTLVASSGTPTLDGVVSAGEWTSTPMVTLAGVTLNAMADGQYLYIAATWPDATGTESIPKNQWSFDGSSWSQSGNEDRIGFIWDMGLNGSDGANCTTMCHAPLMHTNVGFVDVWHWKAARTNAMGFADDKYWDTVDRQSDPGTKAYIDNNDVGGLPEFMALNDPGANVDFLAVDANALAGFDPFGTVFPSHTAEEGVPFDANATFTTGDVIPGYLLQVPAGDRASVQSAGKYANGTWTVEFKKPYGGSDYDFSVVPGSTVDFTHEIFDNQGGSHPNDGFDATVYTLDLSQISAVGIAEPVEDGNIPITYSLAQNYPNPFNPSTIIKFHIPKRSYVHLSIYNVMGQLVETLISEAMQPGKYQVNYGAENLASGIYFYNLTSDNWSQTRKMILMK